MYSFFYESPKEISHLVFSLFSFPGVGITMVLIAIFVTIYYNVIIAYSLYYMFASFQSELPWKNCSYWADTNCSRSPIGKINLLIFRILLTLHHSFILSNKLKGFSHFLTNFGKVLTEP